MSFSQKPMSIGPLKQSILAAKSDWFAVAIFSFGINILMLTGPIFMLQVYDRVLTSRSIPTLTILWTLMGTLFAFLALFTFLRKRLLSRVAFRIDSELMVAAEKHKIIQSFSVGKLIANPVADLARIRHFISGSGVTSFFDLPWTPIFIAIVFYMHPWLGWLTVAGVILITMFTLLSEWVTKESIFRAGNWEVESSGLSQSTQENAESLIAMGMTENILSHWEKLRKYSLGESQKASNATEAFSSLTRGFRMFLQSSILGLGAYLAVYQFITPGMMIAASIIGGRALTPIDQTISNWRGFVGARQAYARVNVLLDGTQETDDVMELPAPKGHLELASVVKASPSEEGTVILQGLTFNLNPGDALGVVGPSASGKSSLAKLLVALWKPERGSIRLDGATFDQWDREKLGCHIGYLSQKASLLRGSIKENIARFDPEARDEDIVAAAQIAGVHKLIMVLPGGYEARIGDGFVLSGGQVQRIALARAVYKLPALIVLDEPNSNLDADGDKALTQAILNLRKAKRTIVVMAHRPSAIIAVNKLLMLKDGKQIEFGEKAEVLKKITGKLDGTK